MESNPYPIVPGIFLAIGVILLLIIFGLRWADLRLIRRWRRIMGTVVHAGLNRAKDSEGTPMYEIEIEYEYTVEGQTYRGSRMRSFDRNYSSSSAQEIEGTIAGLKAGGPLELVYNPRHPEDSMVVRQFTPLSTQVLFAFFAVVFVAAGLIWLLVGASK